MAIVYTTGTINQPDAGSVGLAVAEKIRDDVVAHAAWDLVEEFTAASGTVRWYVFKCLGTANGLGSDFFVVLGRTLSTGELRMAICESYTTAGHMMQYYAPIGNTNLVAFDAQGRYAATFSLATAPFTNTGLNPKNMVWTPAGTSTKWWLTVSEDGFTVALNGNPNGFFHVGAYTWLGQIANPFPIQLMGSIQSDGGMTRNPSMANAASAWVGALTFEGGGSLTSPGSYGPILGYASDLKYNDKAQNNQRPVAEIGMTIASIPGQAGYQATTGMFFGKQKRMRLGLAGSSPVGFAFGDAYALNGKLWVPYAPTDTRIWDTGVASS